MFSNIEETQYGSDPRNPDSMANSPPTNITLSNNVISENQSPGLFIGKISADDPDQFNRIFPLIDFNNSITFGTEYFSIDHNQSIRQPDLSIMR